MSAPTDFATWWNDVGSGLPPFANEDSEEHTHRVCKIAWDAAVEIERAKVARLREVLKHNIRAYHLNNFEAVKIICENNLEATAPNEENP